MNVHPIQVCIQLVKDIPQYTYSYQTYKRQNRLQKDTKTLLAAAAAVAAAVAGAVAAASRERGVYVQPLEAQDQQLCPRLVAYQQQLLQEGLSGEVEQQESLLKTPPTSIYTYTDGDIKETLPFLLLKAQQKGLKHPA